LGKRYSIANKKTIIIVYMIAYNAYLKKFNFSIMSIASNFKIYNLVETVR